MKRGFTLIEMIVSLGLFSVVATLSVSSYLSLVNAQKKAITLQTIQDNVRFTMEIISRNLRAGEFYYCGVANDALFSSAPLITPPNADGLVQNTWTPQNCDIASSGGEGILFLHGRKSAIIYRVNACGDHRCIETAVVDSTNLSSPPQFSAITSTNINMNRLAFYVRGAANGDSVPGLVTIAFQGTAKLGAQTSQFLLNTSVMERQFSRSAQ